MDIESIRKLNDKYSGLSPEKRIQEIYRDFDYGDILITSSFGTSSVYLLSLIARSGLRPDIYFIDTGYLFKETHEYVETLTELFRLNIIRLEPEAAEHSQTAVNHTWKYDPELCCKINKVDPLNRIKSSYEIWMSGILRYQNQYRKNLAIFEDSDILKFNPIIDVTREQITEFIRLNNLPEHPLKKRGYGSLGCTHCTVPGENRNGRWSGREKTECGLHLSEIQKVSS